MRGGTPVVTATMGETPGAPGRPITRWWDLVLECGHPVRRPVRYRPLPIGPTGRRTRWVARNRDAGDILPAQEHAYCQTCPTPPAHDVIRIRIRAAPARAAAFVELLRQLDPALTVGPAEYRAAGFVDIYCESRADLPAPDQERNDHGGNLRP